jgi:hypothetical protein
MEITMKITVLALAILLASVTAYADDTSPKPAVAPVSEFVSDNDFCMATFMVSSDGSSWSDNLKGQVIVDLGRGGFKKKNYPSTVTFLQDMKASGWKVVSLSVVSSVYGGGEYQEIFLFTKN